MKNIFAFIYFFKDFFMPHVSSLDDLAAGRSAKGSQRVLASEKPAEVPAVPPPQEALEDEVKRGTWTVTYPNGERCRTNPDGTSEELKPVMICIASDPDTKQVCYRCRSVGVWVAQWPSWEALRNQL